MPANRSNPTSFQFRAQLAAGGEILAQQATFLPVESASRLAMGVFYTEEIQHWAGFSPVFNINQKTINGGTTVAKEDLQ
jgi:hypothetical protein